MPKTEIATEAVLLTITAMAVVLPIADILTETEIQPSGTTAHGLTDTRIRE